MTESEKLKTLEWIKNWQELGPMLEDLRRDSLKTLNIADAIESFDLAYKSARMHCPRRKTSGLVQQQSWFMMAYR